MDSTTSTQSTTPWLELLGSNNWEGLLDPFDINLRTLILRCGDFCQATYDAFNNDENSKYAGSSRYGKKSFFHKVMLQPSPDDYEIAAFIYATARVSVPAAFLFKSLSREAWDRESNWIGYIAVTSDKTFPVVAAEKLQPWCCGLGAGGGVHASCYGYQMNGGGYNVEGLDDPVMTTKAGPPLLRRPWPDASSREIKQDSVDCTTSCVGVFIKWILWDTFEFKYGTIFKEDADFGG
nr:phospholipase A1-IIdelta-like [Tanacetum cinerariifolium]